MNSLPKFEGIDPWIVARSLELTGLFPFKPAEYISRLASRCGNGCFPGFRELY